MQPKSMDSSLVSFSEASLTMDDWSPRCVASSRSMTTTSRSTPGRLPLRLWKLTPFKLVTACAAMTALLMMFALQRLPREERIVVEKPDIVMQADPGALQETIREPDPAIEPVVRIVQTSKIAVTAPEPASQPPAIDPAPAKMPPALLVQEEDDRPSRHARRPKHEHANDVCARHGLHKVETHGGRSWRCR